MNDSTKSRLRGEVKQEYSEKIEQNSGFCSHVLENEFGYQNDELAGVPNDALENSFGCANPFSFGDIKLGDTVVDLGSGAGLDVILAAKKVGRTGKVIGIDMTATMIEKARMNIQKSGVEDIAEIRNGLIESLPIESGSVDWVISNCVVSLSPEKDHVFAEVSRILKPGGKMILTDQTIEPVPRWLQFLISLKSPASAQALGVEQYFKTVENSGLTQVKLVSRLVYDTASISALARGELNKKGTLLKALFTLNKNQILAHLLDPMITPIAKRFDGIASSIKIYAEKPL